MTRTVPAAVATAIAQDATSPIYLIRMGWATASPEPSYLRVATYAQAITWNSETWAASGAEVRGLTVNGGELILPNGDSDPWLSLVMGEIPRNRAVDIYEYHSSDAVHIFSGIMDEASVSLRQISIRLIEGLLNKHFPPTSFNSTDFPHLLSGGDRLYWGPDIVLIE